MIRAWSYSRLSTYEECPLKAKLKYVVKMPEPSHPAMARGAAIHEEAAAYLSKEKSRVPASLKQLDNLFRALRKKEPEVELQIAFDRTWKTTEWFSSQAWLRVVVDALVIEGPRAIVIDHKTGKIREGYDSQLDLYAAAIFSAYPEVETVEPELWFVDHGVTLPVPPKKYHRDELPTLKKRWAKRALPMLSDKRFAPRAGNYCRWCHFRKSNGGPCKF